MCAAGKTKSTMTATDDIQNDCPGSLIKHLLLLTCLPQQTYHLQIITQMVTFMQACLLPTTSAHVQCCLLALQRSPTLHTHYLLLSPSLLHPDFISAMIHHSRKLLASFLKRQKRSSECHENSNNGAITSRRMGNIFVYMSGGCFAS